VQRRLLPPASIGDRPYDLLSVRQLHSGLFEPIDRMGSTSSSGISSGSDSSMAVAMPSQNQQQEDRQAIQFFSDGTDSGSGRDMPNLDYCVATSTAGVSSSLAEAVQDESTSRKIYI